MSAFIVSTETIHRVVDAIRSRPRDSRATKLLPFDHRTHNPQVIGEMLFALNRDALLERYPAYPDLIDPAPPYCWQPRPANLIVQHKALSCLVHRCTEGDVPTRPLYQALRAIKAEIADEIVKCLCGHIGRGGTRAAEAIVASTHEWQEAKWD